MAKIMTSSSSWVKVVAEDKGSSADVYVRTPPSGASLKLEQVRELIEELVKVAGLQSEPTGSGMGIIIQFPESEAVAKRREELAWNFTNDVYDVASADTKYAIEYIIGGEKQRGELK